jgi:hypothetical protein
MVKTPYTRIVLRYVHDVVTGEFANVGVVLFAPDQRFLRARFVSDYRRLHAIFGEIDEVHLQSIMEHLKRAFANLETRLGRDSRDIGELVHQVLPADDSSLQWSPIGGGVTDDLDGTLNHLFQRFVQRHAEPAPALP